MDGQSKGRTPAEGTGAGAGADMEGGFELVVVELEVVKVVEITEVEAVDVVEVELVNSEVELSLEVWNEELGVEANKDDVDWVLVML